MTEPAIPVIAALPMQAHEDLLRLAKTDWPLLQEPGVRFTVDVTERKDARLAAVVKMHNFSAGGYLTREYDGRYGGGATVQWTPGRNRR